MARVGIVGAGPAGCLTARRLADAGHDAILYEAGERIAPTLDFASLLGRADLHWPDDATLAPSVIRARVVGGAGALNAMLLSAPDGQDLASWDTALGLEHGTARGSLERVIAEVAPQIATPGPLARGLGEAAFDRGDTIGGSTLDVDARGILAAALAARSGERRDGPAVYLDGAPDALRLVTGTTITALDRSPLGEVDHVVVSAGALASPHLVRSVVPDLAVAPAQQHRAVALTVSLAGGQQVARDQPAVSRVLRWSTGLDAQQPGRNDPTRNAPPRNAPTRNAPTRNDVQLVVVDHMGWDPVGRSLGLVIISLLSGSDLAVPADDVDRARLRSGVRRAAELLAAGGFTLVDTVLSTSAPASVIASNDALDRWIAEQPNPVHHVTGTLPIGSAVGRAGLVVGRDDLSVIDASVLPASPRADTNMAVLVIADLLATQLVAHLA